MQQALVCRARDDLEAVKIVDTLQPLGCSNDDIAVPKWDARSARPLGFRKLGKTSGETFAQVACGAAGGGAFGAFRLDEVPMRHKAKT